MYRERYIKKYIHTAVKVWFFSSMYSVLHSFITWLYYSLLPPLHSKELTEYGKIEILSNFIYLGLVFSNSKDSGDVFYLGFNTELG